MYALIEKLHNNIFPRFLQVARATGFKLYESIGLQVNYKTFLQGRESPVFIVL
jgi:hypothetical protein